MLFLPFDAFGAYQKGRQSGIDDNWKDIFNYEKADKMSRDNYEGNATSESRVQRVQADNQFVIDTAPGRTAATNSDYQLKLDTNPLRGQALNTQNGNVVAAGPSALTATILANEANAGQNQIFLDSVPGQRATAQVGSRVGVATASELGPFVPQIAKEKAATTVAQSGNALNLEKVVVPARQGADVAGSANITDQREQQLADRQFGEVVGELMPLMSAEKSPERAAQMTAIAQKSFPGLQVELDPATGQYMARMGDAPPVLFSQVLLGRDWQIKSRLTSDATRLPTTGKGKAGETTDAAIDTAIGAPTPTRPAPTMPAKAPAAAPAAPVTATPPVAAPAPVVPNVLQAAPAAPAAPATAVPNVLPPATFQEYVARNFGTPNGRLEVVSRAIRELPVAQQRLAVLAQGYAQLPQGSPGRAVLQAQINALGTDIEAMQRVAASVQGAR